MHSQFGLSQYDDMVIEADKVAPVYLVYAGFFSWLLLAGFLVSPSTYASISDIRAINQAGIAGQAVITIVKNWPLVGIAIFGCLTAALGLTWLWWKERRNYIWITRYLIMSVYVLLSILKFGVLLTHYRPTILHSAMGITSTFLNVYTVQQGQWSITAIVTVSIMGLAWICSIALYVFYNFFVLNRLKYRSVTF